MNDELLNRAEAFAALELPGQPQFMHIGTANLVHDLAARVRELEAERDAMRADNERLRGLLREVRDWRYPDDPPYTLHRRIEAALAREKPC